MELDISSPTMTQRLNKLCALNPDDLIRNSLIGIEKESLRVDKDGNIAATPHPQKLGSALTHSSITTDYSESLMELITAPHTSVQSALQELDDIHRWVYQNLDDEFLWSTSMPCLLAGEESIPIAAYGDSNMGMMKTVYRRGLGHRYGKIMQVIAGVHFNYSFPPEFWAAMQEIDESDASEVDYRSEGYMGMMRNLQRIAWLIPYLFGSSPAVCESFLNSKPTTLEYLGHGTYYEPFATSLRLGDIGYQNKKEGSLGVRISDNNLDEYIATLEQATTTPCPNYAKIGIEKDGEFRQLSNNRLQIENEYYSSVRAKAVPGKLEKPNRALQRKGIEYIELRSLDVDVFEPLGVSEMQLCFLEPLMIYALLKESPPISDAERSNLDNNQSLVAHCGRDPNLSLSLPDGKSTIREWASTLLRDMEPICEWLDQGLSGKPYSAALKAQQVKVFDPSTIPSTRVMNKLVSDQTSFFDFAINQSRHTAEYFKDRPLESALQDKYRQMTKDTLQKQKDIEAEPQQPFAEFLADYFAG